MINVALLSKWHVHADGYVRDINNNDDLSIKVVWDEDASRGEKWAEELGVPFERNLTDVLTNPEIDAVIVNTPTSLHKEVIIEAAKHKKHIFTEKVLAFTVEDCEEIYKAVEASNVQMTVSLPRLTDRNFVYADKAIKEGWLGDLTMIRCRLAHNGGVPAEGQEHGWLPENFYNEEETGGGAMIDLGAHPIYLANRFAGKPEAVYARLYKLNNDQVDDNSALIVEYDSGIIGMVETSFLSHGSPFQFELYGTEGSLLIENDEVTVQSTHLDDEKKSEIAESVRAQQMPMLQWVDAIKTNTPTSITKEDVINLTLINEAAFKSHDEQRRIKLSEIK